MRRFLLVLVFILTSCAGLGSKKIPQFPVHKMDIHPGFVKKIKIEFPLEGERPELVCANKNVGYDIEDGFLRAYISSDYNTEDKSFDCSLVFSNGSKKITRKIIQFQNVEYPYPASRLYVDKKHVQLSEKNLQRFLKEKKQLQKVYSNLILDRALFDKPFVRPLNSKVTSVFGTKRVFNNKKHTWHSGTDLRARMRTPIPSANKGKVVFTGHLFFNGKTVFVDHGLGILTMYCHLSKILVNEGDIVNQKDILALSGNTGRSNAPHLHWGVKVQDHWINGLELIKQGL